MNEETNSHSNLEIEPDSVRCLVRLVVLFASMDRAITGRLTGGRGRTFDGVFLIKVRERGTVVWTIRYLIRRRAVATSTLFNRDP